MCFDADATRVLEFDPARRWESSLVDRPGGRRRTVRRAGFSLVELMVVVIIIGLIAGAATLSVRSYLIRGKQNVARMEIAKIVQALETYYAEFDRYPSNDEGIEALSAPSDVFPDGLISQVRFDPWKHPYEYMNPGPDSPFEVISYGADGREGGTGADRDITSSSLDDDSTN